MHRVLSLLAILIVALPAASNAQDPVTNLPVVVTSGEGVVTAAPDRAFVTLATESRAKDPREAQNKNSAAMSAVQDKLRAAGVAKEAVRTVAFNIQQEFDYVNGRQVPREFVARHAIEVRIDEIERAGAVIDAAVQSGAASVSQVRFDIKDRPRAEREALRLAVADARARADAAAAGAGRSIDRVLKIEESREMGPRPPIPMMMSRAGGAEQVAAPVAEGELEIRARVTLTAVIR
jgi:uncharacterized protein